MGIVPTRGFQEKKTTHDDMPMTGILAEKGRLCDDPAAKAAAAAPGEANLNRLRDSLDRKQS